MAGRTRPRLGLLCVRGRLVRPGNALALFGVMGSECADDPRREISARLESFRGDHERQDRVRSERQWHRRPARYQSMGGRSDRLRPALERANRARRALMAFDPGADRSGWKKPRTKRIDAKERDAIIAAIRAAPGDLDAIAGRFNLGHS